MDIVQHSGGEFYATAAETQHVTADRTSRPAAPSSAPYIRREPGTRTLLDLILGIALWLATWVAIIVIFLLLE